MILKNTIPILFIVCLGTSVSGQSVYWPGSNTDRSKIHNNNANPKDLRHLSVGGSFGLLYYFGDLSPASTPLSTDFTLSRPGISLLLNYKYTPQLNLRAELMYGRIMGDDFNVSYLDNPNSAGRYVRNLSFRNDLVELTLAAELNLFKDSRPYYARKRFNVYLLGGLGLLYQNPMGKVPEFKRDNSRFPNAGAWVALRPLGTEGQFSPHYNIRPYSNFQLVMPIGGGFRFRITQHLDVNLEIAYRITFTDYLDDVSNKYVDLGALDSDLARSMSDRSLEETAAISGEKRNFEAINGITTEMMYSSKYQDAIYYVYQGHGPNSQRGGPSRDYYMATSIKISYIFGRITSYGKKK